PFTDAMTLLVLLLFFQSVVCWHLHCPKPSHDDKVIPIGVFVPFPVTLNGSRSLVGTPPPAGDLLDHTGYWETNGGDFAPAISLALHHIRNHSCVLSGYRIELIYKSTQCSPALGMKALFDVISRDPKPVAIFGGQCTNVNDPIAMALKYWHIVQLSYAETHPKFSSADAVELYPTFFRVVPAYRNSNEAKVELIKHFKWNRIATIKQSDESRFALPHEKLTAHMESRNLTIIRTVGISKHEKDNIGIEMDTLKALDAHIIVLDAEQNMALGVLCEAYRREMYGSNFVWILPGYQVQRYDVNQFNFTEYSCTKEEAKVILDRHFAVEFAKERRRRDVKLPHGKVCCKKNSSRRFSLTAHEVLEEMRRKHVDTTMWSTFLYDGMWTLAMAMAKELNRSPEDIFHEDFMNAMTNIDFQGVTGRIKFSANERLGIVDVKQYIKGKYHEIGKYDGNDQTFELNSTKYAGWSATADQTFIDHRTERISDTLRVAFSLLAVVGIILSLLFLIVNVRYRNHRFIKMSSPNLNNVIIIGSIFTYSSVILLGIDTQIIEKDHFPFLCTARTWVLCLGFTLAFGSMFSKTWRVHSIFTNIRMDKKAIKVQDSKLFLMLGVLLLLDIVVLSLWAIFAPFKEGELKLPDVFTNNSVIKSTVETCESKASLGFQIVLLAIKGILMILGCFLAWETRRVNIPALNDSKYIGLSVYVVVVMSVIGLSIAFILQNRVNEAYALTCLFIIFSTTLTLCLLFVPKLIELVRNPQGIEPKGYRRGLMKSVVNKQKTTIPTSSNDDCKDLLSRAEAENQLKHRILQEKSAQLWELLERLRDLGDTTFMQQDWCFGSSGIVSGPPTTTPDSDPLLGGSRKSEHSSSDRTVAFREPSTSSARNCTNNKDEWPWSNPDEPSTML
ncbi:hypothetical protein PENTCL1PPCAC_18687, partial [Pristionchus entomophagus]